MSDTQTHTQKNRVLLVLLVPTTLNHYNNNDDNNDNNNGGLIKKKKMYRTDFYRFFFKCKITLLQRHFNKFDLHARLLFTKEREKGRGEEEKKRGEREH